MPQSRSHKNTALKTADPDIYGRKNKFPAGMWPYVLLASMIFAVYSQTIGFGFINFDDLKLISLSMRQLQEQASVGNILTGDAFGSKTGIFYYRPVLSLSLLTDAYLSGGAPWLFHLSNILLHILACCLFLGMLRQLGFKNGPAWFMALAFGIHPALVQAVAWIPGRNDILLAIFLLLTVIGLYRYFRDGRFLWLLLGMGSYLLALFTKETAGLFMVMLTLSALMVGKQAGNKKMLSSGFAALSVSAFWLAARYFAASGRVGNDMPITENVRFALRGLISYAGKTILPFGLSIVPDYRDVNILIGLTAMAAMIIIFVRRKPANPKIFFLGLSAYFLFLIPAVLNETFLEHRLYLPLLGLLSAIMALGLPTDSPGKNKAYLFQASLVAVVFIFLNVRHALAFRDEGSAWMATIKTSPNSWIANNAMALLAIDKGNAIEAERFYNKALALNPGNPKVTANLGLLYLKMGRPERAASAFRSILKADPKYPGANYNLGQALDGLKRYDEAGECYREELRIDPLNKNAGVSLSASLSEAGRLREARDALFAVLRIDRNSYDALVNLGVIEYRLKDIPAAQGWLEKAVKIAPERKEGHVNLGYVYRAGNKESEALREFKIAAKLDPSYLKLINGKR